MIAPAGRRNKDIAAIHVLAKQLGLSEDERRDVLFTLTGHRSCAELDFTALARVRAHLAQRARKTRPAGSMTPEEFARLRDRGERPKPAADRVALVVKVRALLEQLHKWDEYADAIARRMFHVDRYEWCMPDQLRKVVAALVITLRRQQRGTGQGGR